MRRNKLAYSDERNSTELDYLIEGVHSVEIKTKDRTVKPKLNYDCCVPMYNHDHQQADFFIFVSLLRDRGDVDHPIRRFKFAYIVGIIDLQTLEREGMLWEGGSTDEDNGTTFWTDCLNVKISDLTPIKEMIGVFNG